METVKGIRVVGYVRVSRVGGREGDSFLSPALQRETVERLAERKGLEIVEWIEESDASGGDASRPGWNRAMEIVEAGAGRAIAVWNLSRFSRSLRDFLNAVERIETAGGRLFSATEQLGDGPAGRMTVNVLVSVAQMERERAAVGSGPPSCRRLSAASTSAGASRLATDEAPTGGWSLTRSPPRSSRALGAQGQGLVA